MSDYESHVGKLERVNKTVYELFDELLNTGFKVPKYYKKPYIRSDMIDMLRDEKNYVFTSKGIFKILKDDVIDDDDIFEIDDNLNYKLRFYNGGCGFDEAIGIALQSNKNLKSKKDKFTPEQIKDNLRALNRCEQEGYGYAVINYSDGSEYIDPCTRKLWKEVAEKLNKLKNYLEQFKKLV